MYFCIVNQTFERFPSNGKAAYAKRELITKKNKKMKRRIIYVGTLIDLARMFEPDEEAESIGVTKLRIEELKLWHR